ncbi:MAG: fluoride efflux transporter CrcB [Pelovirga sp.]
MKILYIGLFGGFGCIARYLLTIWTQQLAGRDFPYGTVLVNVLGSFLLGLLLTLGVRQFPVSPDIRLGLAVGFLGGFTTFSTFSYQTLMLLEEGNHWPAVANVVLNVSLSLAAVFAGMLVARQLV